MPWTLLYPSIYLFFGHKNQKGFYEEIWNVTQKVFSQVILFIDILKFMKEKAGSLSASKWISYLRNMQWRKCYYGPIGFYI